MTWHPEVLSTRQRRVLGALGPWLTARGYYLAGGTALALQYGHRRSVDLDWFRRDPMGEPARLVADLRDAGFAIRIDELAEGTIHGRMSGVRISLLELRYPVLEPLVPVPEGDGPSDMAGPLDIGAMKLLAIAQRGTKKDFVDLHALLRHGLTLPRLLEAYRRKFQVEDVAHVIYACAYFEDAARERMPKMLDDVSWRRVRADVEREVVALA